MQKWLQNKIDKYAMVQLNFYVLNVIYHTRAILYIVFFFTVCTNLFSVNKDIINHIDGYESWIYP